MMLNYIQFELFQIILKIIISPTLHVVNLIKIMQLNN